MCPQFIFAELRRNRWLRSGGGIWGMVPMVVEHCVVVLMMIVLEI